MDPEQRQRAANSMANRSDLKIMICGLKCGSEGLNWPWANHAVFTYVILSPARLELKASISDLWWNSCV